MVSIVLGRDWRLGEARLPTWLLIAREEIARVKVLAVIRDTFNEFSL